jgi:predicted GNAT family N-acyltransferase
MLRRDSQSISALVSAGAAALDAYAAFLFDCVRLADEEVRKTRRPLSIGTPSTVPSWMIRSPLEQVAHESDGAVSNWMSDVRSFRGSVLFDNGRRPHFQTKGDTFLDDDPADAYAHHILTYHGERLVGCVRVYCPAVDTPPCVTETLLGEHAFVLMLEKLGLQRSSVVEIGRWMVDPDHRSSGWLAAQLAAGSAALANALKYVSETPRDIVLCSVGTIDRQDAMLGRIGLTELRGVNQVYRSNYADIVRVFSCSTIESLSPRFQRLIMEMAIKLDIGQLKKSR